MCKIMVVDDEPLVREAISHVISSEFDSITLVGSTGSGDKAIELAQKERPDIIIMDIRLDDKDGLSAIEDIYDFLPRCVMMVISAYDTFSYARQALRLGVADYLLKPLNKQDIIDIINNARLRLETVRKNRNNFAAKKDIAGKEAETESFTAGYDKNIPLEKERELLRYIDLGNYPRATEKLQEICHEIEQDFSRPEIKSYSRELLIVILRQIFSVTDINSQQFKENFAREDMISALQTADSGKKALEILQDQFRQLLNYIARESDRDFGADDTLHKARNYLESNFDKPLNLDKVAGEVGLSSSYLSRSFKQKFGVSFTDYLNQLRLDRSKRLLRHSNKNIGEIAEEVGFNDGNYFSKVFKREEGVTPTEYRKKL